MDIVLCALKCVCVCMCVYCFWKFNNLNFKRWLKVFELLIGIFNIWGIFKKKRIFLLFFPSVIYFPLVMPVYICTHICTELGLKVKTETFLQTTKYIFLLPSQIAFWCNQKKLLFDAITRCCEIGQDQPFLWFVSNTQISLEDSHWNTFCLHSLGKSHCSSRLQ